MNASPWSCTTRSRSRPRRRRCWRTHARHEASRPSSVRSDALPDAIDAVVGVGGDGTVLRAAALAMAEELPVAGINVGRVGYLAEFAYRRNRSIRRRLLRRAASGYSR